jgi:hypothetical protein
LNANKAVQLVRAGQDDVGRSLPHDVDDVELEPGRLVRCDGCADRAADPS